MSLDQLKTELQLLVTPLDATILSIGWDKLDANKVLQVIINHPNGVDIDLCVAVSDAITETVDSFLDDEENFYLEVTSAGAEAPFTTYEELANSVGAWIHMELINPKSEGQIFEGELLDATDDLLTVGYKNKTRNMKITVAYDELKLIRRAVKF